MADEPSAGAAQGAAEDTAVQGAAPDPRAAGTGTGETGAPPTGAGAGPATGVNQGAAGNRPLGESPLSAQHNDKDAFAERPEAFVGAAFAGGLVLALVLRRMAR
jgi:hypothetical protein